MKIKKSKSRKHLFHPPGFSGCHSKPASRFHLQAVLLLWGVFMLMGGCAAVSESPDTFSPDFGKSLNTGFAAQVIHPDAPLDPSPVNTLPGELGAQIYNKRYIKSLTEESQEKEGVNNQLKGL